jgi:hypothetical protein
MLARATISYEATFMSFYMGLSMKQQLRFNVQRSFSISSVPPVLHAPPIELSLI